MIPRQLSLRNVRTYERLDLDLPEAAVAIIGQNGAGKSTIVNAIDVALFGPQSRTLADWLSEDKPGDSLNITLTFEHEGDMYRARRTYSGKGRGQSKFDLEHLLESRTENGHGLNLSEAIAGTWEPLTIESQASTQTVLEELLGLNRDTFRASSFISQGVMFCDLQPREQKRILGELLELGQWETWKDRAAKERRTTEAELDRLAGALERAEQELAERSLVEQERAEAVIRQGEAQRLLDAALSRLARAREALAEARGKVESRAGAERAVQRAEQGWIDLSDSIAAREATLVSLDERLASKPRLEEFAAVLPELQAEQESTRALVQQWEKRSGLLGDQKRLLAESETLNAKIAALQAQASQVLDGIGSEHCDRCGQVLGQDAAERSARSYREDADAFALRDNAIQEAELPILNLMIGELPAEPPDPVLLERLPKLPDMIRARSTALAQIAQLDEAEARRGEIAVELERMRAGLPEREKACVDARAELEALGPHDPSVLEEAQMELSLAERQESTARLDLSTSEKQIARADERLERLEKIAAEAGASRDRRDILHTDLDLYTRLERACGQNGVPALILEQIAIPRLEAAADEILQRFGSKALGVQLLTQREKRDGGLADTLQVNVLTEYGSRDYRTFSTGERLRINAAITLAIAQLVASRSAHTGLLVIDDLGPLDAQGMAVLADICNDLQRTVGRVYVISQNAELRDAFDQSLTIESVNGRSRVVGDAPEPIPAMEGLAS